MRGDEKIQSQLEGCKQNKTAYERLASSLSEVVFEKSAKQCLPPCNQFF